MNRFARHLWSALPSSRGAIFAALSLGSVSTLVATTEGCGSPLVGLSCADGYSDCNGDCVDLSSDERHCGACGTVCASDEICEERACVPESDADGGRDSGADAGDGGLDADIDDDGGNDSGMDGGGDSSVDDGGNDSGMDTGAFPDVDLPPICTGPGSPANCVCGLGQLKCDDTCFDGANDPDHCGACDNVCTPLQICAGGVCAVNCAVQGLANCGGVCVDTDNDPDNCGSCGNQCASGLCGSGECLGATVGHVIVIGHDMSTSNGAMRRLAGNGVFLPGGDPLRVLLYEELARPAVRTGVRGAIQNMATIEGRTPDLTVAQSPLTVPFLLGQTDVFVIASQANATDDNLVKNGEAWGRAMRDFVDIGGVVVLFDGGGSNAGTYQILDTAGLFQARSRSALSRRTLELESRGDAVASFVQVMYQSDGETVGFDTDETTVVVRDPQSTLPVVVHIAR